MNNLQEKFRERLRASAEKVKEYNAKREQERAEAREKVQVLIREMREKAQQKQ